MMLTGSHVGETKPTQYPETCNRHADFVVHLANGWLVDLELQVAVRH